MSEHKEKGMQFLRENLEAMGKSLTESQEKKFIRYYELLLEWNARMNLTAITDFDEVVCKHFLDSLLLFHMPEAMLSGTVIDIGTGAGFPGLPLAIMCPGLQITLLDSLQKRIGFLDACVQELGLSGVRTIHGRAEEAARQTDLREQFDMAVSRAVAALPVLCEYCLPFVKPGGQFAAYKSQKAEDEIREAARAIQILGGREITHTGMQLPGTDAERTIILIRKEKPTPRAYPRKAGTPGKKPL